MKKAEQKCLKEDIRNIKLENIEEFFLFLKYCFYTYVKSIQAFGYHHPVTNSVVEIWKEFLDIRSEESFILNILGKSDCLGGFFEISDFLDELDLLNEKEIKYYYNELDSIEDACLMKKEYKAKRGKKDFDGLTNTNLYQLKLCSLLLSFRDIQAFLDYPDEFWDYISDRILYADSYFDEEKDFYGVYIQTDKDECVTNIKVIVPHIINLETALVQVHEFQHAYSLYQILGSKIVMDDNEYEQEARKYEADFQEKYMVKKYEEIFSKKR